jgi:hypothetical protein
MNGMELNGIHSELIKNPRHFIGKSNSERYKDSGYL